MHAHGYMAKLTDMPELSVVPDSDREYVWNEGMLEAVPFLQSVGAILDILEGIATDRRPFPLCYVTFVRSLSSSQRCSYGQ